MKNTFITNEYTFKQVLIIKIKNWSHLFLSKF